jgi:hypothetical protein
VLTQLSADEDKNMQYDNNKTFTNIQVFHIQFRPFFETEEEEVRY